MSNILHSLPWTLALAMAQAGNAEEVSLPVIEAARLVLESGFSDAGSLLDAFLSADLEAAKSGAPEG